MQNNRKEKIGQYSALNQKKIGELIIKYLLETDFEADKHYKLACAWYGALKLAKLLRDDTLLSRLISRYENFYGKFEPLLSGKGHVDNNVFGIVPLEIARVGGDERYKKEGLALAEHQYKNISHQIRYAIDDMFMITSLQVQAYRVSGNDKYRDLAAETMVSYLDKLQQDDGLFFHHTDFQHRWCRGNGWVAAGFAELIQVLPENHCCYFVIRKAYQKMMNGLLHYQIKEGHGSGLWKQIINSEDKRNWPESSGSAMFCYSLITGINYGWLDQSVYGPAADKAWQGLETMLSEKGEVQNISKWAYKPESHPESADKYEIDEENYYFDREKLTGENHGQAPLMWIIASLIK